ncbi:quinolinate synthase NadA [bacterium]|nr:quinolinate synthase NadA [bacterium]
MADVPIATAPLLGNEPIDPELQARIARRKEELGDRVVILGHHYQRDDVIDFSDRRGDSLDLSLFAAELKGIEYVIFCGVHFMAETADILTPDSVQVLLPDMRAGCSMADMADIDQVEEAWDVLTDATDATFIPITYINSTAALKGFCGRHGGGVCTSSNARMIVEWAFAQGEKLLFFPDQHLGRNTCYDLGIGLEDMIVYDPAQPDGGNDPEAYAKAKVVLWKGHCSVHQNFQPSHPDIWRQRVPGIQVIVHPECMFEVVQKADQAGSTKHIIQAVEASPASSKWAIGTEHHLVNRLKNEHPDKFIASLAPFACQCSTMFRISPEALAESLDSIAESKPKNVIRVDDETRKWALVALERMMKMR